MVCIAKRPDAVAGEGSFLADAEGAIWPILGGPGHQLSVPSCALAGGSQSSDYWPLARILVAAAQFWTTLK